MMNKNEDLQEPSTTSLVKAKKPLIERLRVWTGLWIHWLKMQWSRQ